ncbi:MAG: hypothetical protein VZR00_11635 [Lachnospiraceae bacterium]|nr:hypothetical protein [Lachnospiraceae bacterium]
MLQIAVSEENSASYSRECRVKAGNAVLNRKKAILKNMKFLLDKGNGALYNITRAHKKGAHNL